jgi:hypothetical protein
LLNGDGGHVIIWADQLTGFYGKINARGGMNFGNGGFVEVSGKQDLIFQGLVDILAAKGNPGTLLLDPLNITIANATSSPPGVDNQLNGTSQILAGDYSPNSITIAKSTLEALTGNVLLEATNNITINNGVSLNFSKPGGSITFKADANNQGVGSFSMNQSDSITTALQRDITISGANVTVGTLNTRGDTTSNTLSAIAGNVTLSARNSIRTGNIDTWVQVGNGGQVTLILTGSGGSITTGSIQSLTYNEGNGGNVTINANGGSITTANINSYSNVSSSNYRGGNIQLNNASTIITDGLNDNGLSNFTALDAPGGVISLNATGSIKTGNINNKNNTISIISGSSVTTGNLRATSTDPNDPTGGSINLAASSNITTGNITTKTNNVNLNGLVILVSDVSINIGGTGGDTIFGSTVNGNHNLLINAGSNGNVTFNGAVGNITPLSSLNIDSAKNTTLAGSITSNNGNIRFNSPVTLAGNSVELNAGTATIELLSTLAAGSNNLTLTGDEINFARTISGTGNLTLQPFTPTQGITIGETRVTSNLDLTAAKLSQLQNGFNSITIGRDNGSSAITLGDDITFNNPLTLRSPFGSGSINTTGFTLTGTNDATITLLANQNITTGNIINPGREITLTSTNGSIDTSAGTLDTRSASDGGDITLTANNGNITASTLNSFSQATSGNAGNGGNITLNAASSINITNEINSFSEARSGSSGRGGAITLSVTNGSISTGILNSFSEALAGSNAGNGGNITLNAASSINITNEINSFSEARSGSSGRGGAITLSVTNGSISTGILNSFSNALGGSAESGGTITLTATNGSINTGNLFSFSNAPAGASVMAAPLS